MAIQHVITAQASGKGLTIDELRAFIDTAYKAGALPTDIVASASGFGSGLRRVVVTVTSEVPVLAPIEPLPTVAP